MTEPNGTAPGLSSKAGMGGSDGNAIRAAIRALSGGDVGSTITRLLTRAAPALSPHTDVAASQFSSVWSATRPWGEFFNKRKFSPPSNASDLRERLVDNLTHFSSNYVLCFLIVSAASILVHPLSFLAVLVVAAAYVWLFLSNPDAVRLGPLLVPSKAKLPVFAVFAAAALYLSNAVATLGSWALFGVLLSFAHAGARVSAKEPDFESPVEPV